MFSNLYVKGKPLKIRFFIILFLSLFITLFLVTIKGNYFERLFIIAYQNITGKKGQQILTDDSGIPVVFYEGRPVNSTTLLQ